MCYLMSEMDETEKENIFHKLNLNPPEYNVPFVTPETVLTPTVFELLRQISSNDLLNFFVIDEAHCIDMWGSHFRPSYSKLRKFADFGGPMSAMAQQPNEQRMQSSRVYVCQKTLLSYDNVQCLSLLLFFLPVIPFIKEPVLVFHAKY